jgi:hypothetical protein
MDNQSDQVASSVNPLNIPIPQFPTNHKNISLDQIISLREKGLSTGQIGKILGCSKTTVIYHLRYNGYDKDIVKTFKNNRSDLFAWMQERFVSSISDEDIKKTPVGSRVLAVAQLYDKERLETGQSSSNLAVNLGLDTSSRRAIHGLSGKLSRIRHTQDMVVEPSDNSADNDD